jgi:hypothetical protein
MTTALGLGVGQLAALQRSYAQAAALVAAAPHSFKVARLHAALAVALADVAPSTRVGVARAAAFAAGADASPEARAHAVRCALEPIVPWVDARVAGDDDDDCIMCSRTLAELDTEPLAVFVRSATHAAACVCVRAPSCLACLGLVLVEHARCPACKAPVSEAELRRVR